MFTSFPAAARRLSVAVAATTVLALAACEMPSGDRDTDSEYPFRVQTLGQLSLSEPESGVLGRTDTINARDGSYYKVYELELEKDRLFSLSAQAEGFTPVLSLFTADGTPLGTTADQGHFHGGDASFIHRTATSGSHLLVLSGASAGDMGNFSLRMEELESGGELDFPGSVTGVLHQDNERHPTRGAPMQAYPLVLEEETALDIQLDSNDFDAYLTLVHQADRSVVVEDDDSGQGLNARIMTQLPAGEYEIWATSLGGNGRFTLSADISEIPDVAEFVFGETYEGHLGFNRQPVPGSYRTGQAMTFLLEEDGELTATMTSEAIDTYLVLTDADDRTVAQNDDAIGMGTDSQIVQTLAPGEYTLWATSYGGSESGQFRLETEFEPQP